LAQAACLASYSDLTQSTSGALHIPGRKTKNKKKKPREKKRTLEAQLQLSLIAVSQASTYFITNTVCRATHAPLATTHRHSIVCVSICQERGAFCSVLFFFGFSRCFSRTNLHAQGCIAIMVASKAASRAASVMSNSNARGVVKRRNKPYKTEQQKIVAKKRKLDIRVCSSLIPSNMPALQY
jgi:hypothetical protein